MLTNKVYLGIIVHNGESYEGGFPAIVSRATFEAVQKVLKQRARPRKIKKRHNFPFVGLFTLWRVWRSHYRAICPRTRRNLPLLSLHKKLGKCSQRYLREDLLADQLKSRLQNVALGDDWAEKMNAQVDVWEKDNVLSSQSFAQNLDEKIKEAETKLDKLVNAFFRRLD